MRIEYPADHLDLAHTLAKWHHEQWSYLAPHKTLEHRIAELQTHDGRKQIPTTVVAMPGNRPVGSASLVQHDMDTRMDLSPWLAGVFVRPEHRRTGIGSALVRRVEDEAKGLDIGIFFLYTPDQEALYARLGWIVNNREEYRGQRVVVMRRLLTTGD